MNKYLLRASKIVLCALFASTSSFYATPEQEHLTHVVEATHRHFRHKAMPWSQKFLYSNEKYRTLVEEFKQHLALFDQEVVALLHNSATTERGELTQMAHIIIKDLKQMINEMKNELTSLVGCTSSVTFMIKMKSAQNTMGDKLTMIESKMKKFKQTCDKHQALDLRTSVIGLEKAILEFKKSNSNNAASALMKRIPTFVK